jgi:hypothetical protein
MADNDDALRVNHDWLAKAKRLVCREDGDAGEQLLFNCPAEACLSFWVRADWLGSSSMVKLQRH